MEECENFLQNKYGYCYYALEKDKPAVIYNLYVESKYRKQGHARKLLRNVIREIRESGYNKQIQIEVRPREDSISSKNLISFYESLGLEILNVKE